MRRDACIRNPTIFTIVTSQPVLHDERLSRLKSFGVNLETALQIVRMHALSPAVPHFLMQTSAGKLQPRLVKESAKFVDGGHPDKNWCGIGHNSETLLAFA